MAGLSKTRLERLHDAAKRGAEQGDIAGAITLVERGGDLDINIAGLADRERNLPMKRDTIFRLASMSKPVTGAAAMILVEEGKLRLDEPIDRLVPELANRKVLRSMDGPVDDTVPARRPITLRDCLTFRLGHGILGLGPPTTPFGKAMAEQGLGFGSTVGLDEWIKRLGNLPLAHQPGERVLYNTGSDVAGLMIARASGMSFSEFLKQRLFEPLGMKDTAFHVPAGNVERFSSCYAFNYQKRELELQDDARAPNGLYAKPPAFESGGGGLVSTLDDYLAFGRMMLNKGKHGNKRLLARPSVETMTSDYLTAEQKRTSGWFPGSWDGRGWGLGVAVITDRLSIAHSPGRFGWDGAFGTQWWADPSEGMTMMLMVQRAGGPSNLGLDFLTLAYQAIED